MSKGGGSTQSQTTKVEIPKWLEDAAQANIARAKQTADIGYVPNYGLDVAAFSPLQQQGMQATGMGAQAFGFAPQGFDATAGIPTPETVNGFTGYRSGNLFDEALQQLATRRPAQYLGMQQLFTDPVTGTASVPTAMETLTNPNATDAQKQALLGTYQPSEDSGVTINPLDQYRNALKWAAGDGGIMQDVMQFGLMGPVIDAVSKSNINNFLDSYTPHMDSGYGLIVDPTTGEYSTTNQALADNMGWSYRAPTVVTPTSTGFTYTGGYANDPSSGSYDMTSASRNGTSLSSYSGGGSSLGVGGGNTSRGFTTGGW